MPDLRVLIYGTLAVASAVLVTVWGRQRRRRSIEQSEEQTGQTGWPRPGEYVLGFVTNFFDALGIGSFAPTTAFLRMFHMVSDRLIPGTLVVGHALPTVAQSLIYVTIVPVDMVSLVALVAAAVAGSWLGAGVVAHLPKQKIQLAMGTALLGAACIMLGRLLGIGPAGGDAIGLAGWPLVIGVCGNFALGALMTLGIGAYAPSLILFGFLGMGPKAIFPIMMTSCGVLQPVSGVRFVQSGSFAPRTSLGLTLAGIIGVLIAAYIVKELPLLVLRWMVLGIVMYTGISLLRAGRQSAATVLSSASSN